MDVGLLILRIAFGMSFAAHGTQKLFGWLGGYGVKGLGGFLESLGFRPGRPIAGFLGLTEIIAGLLLATGFLTPLAGAVFVGVMLNAIVLIKRKDGWIGGYELEALYLFAGLAVAFIGSGAYSLDAAAGWNLAGTAWGLGALALGIVTGMLTLASRRPQPAQISVATEERRAA